MVCLDTSSVIVCTLCRVQLLVRKARQLKHLLNHHHQSPQVHTVLYTQCLVSYVIIYTVITLSPSVVAERLRAVPMHKEHRAALEQEGES